MTLLGSDERGKDTMIVPQLQAPYIVSEDSVVVEDMLRSYSWLCLRMIMELLEEQLI